MDNVLSNEASSTTIEVVEACGEWFVRVSENGKVAVRSFESEPYAMAFAERRRIRLGLQQIAKLYVLIVAFAQAPFGGLAWASRTFSF